MNMSVSQFVPAPAMVRRSRSVWREIIDTVMEGRRERLQTKSPNILSGTSTICRQHYGLSLSGVACAYRRRENLFDDVRQASKRRTGHRSLGAMVGVSGACTA